MWQQEARFLWKNPRNLGAIGCITYNCTVTLNPRRGARNLEVLLRRAFSLQKIQKLGAIGRIRYKFTVTLTTRHILPAKTKGFWGVVRDVISLENTRNSGAVGRLTYNFTININVRCILCDIHKDSSRLAEDCGRGVYKGWEGKVQVIIQGPGQQFKQEGEEGGARAIQGRCQDKKGGRRGEGTGPGKGSGTLNIQSLLLLLLRTDSNKWSADRQSVGSTANHFYIVHDVHPCWWYRWGIFSRVAKRSFSRLAKRSFLRVANRTPDPSCGYDGFAGQWFPNLGFLHMRLSLTLIVCDPGRLLAHFAQTILQSASTSPALRVHPFHQNLPSSNLASPAPTCCQ